MISDLNNIEFNLKEKKEFFNSLQSLYEAAMPIGDVFKSIMNSTGNEKIRTVCSIISKQIDKGKTLEEAMSPCSHIIGKAYSLLISAGEEAGKLENILSNICDNITKQQEIKSNMITALIYPVCMLLLAIGVGLLYQFFVIPSFKSVTEDIHVNTVTLFITAILKIAFVFAIIFGSTYYFLKSDKMKKKVKNFIASLWIIKGILKNYYLANFFYILALAYDAGVPAANSIALANSVIGIEKINNKIKKAEIMVQEGTSISKALNFTNIFSGFAISQVSAGEESGKLDKTLKIAAREYENQMDIAIKIMMKLLGPLVLILVGIIVALVVARGYSEYYKALFSMF